MGELNNWLRQRPLHLVICLYIVLTMGCCVLPHAFKHWTPAALKQAEYVARGEV